MARRSVTATFSAGMVSDEMKADSARYIENFIPVNHGLVPVGPLTERNFSSTGMNGASSTAGTTSVGGSVTIMGWTGGVAVGDWMASVGVKANSSATSGMIASQASGGWDNALIAAQLDVSDNVTRRYAQNGYFRPMFGDVPNSTSTTALTSLFSRRHGIEPNRYRWVNLGDEAICVGGGIESSSTASTGGVARYSGRHMGSSRGLLGTTTSTSVTGLLNMTGMVTPASSSTTGAYSGGTYTNRLSILSSSTSFNYLIDEGMYIGIAMGRTSAQSSGTAADTSQYLGVKSFRINRVIWVTTGEVRVEIDRFIQFGSSATYARCAISTVAGLDVSQLDLSAKTQPWGGDEYRAYDDYTGFTRDVTPVAAESAYHGGRLFLGNILGEVVNGNANATTRLMRGSVGSRIRWSATVDETLEITSTSYFATASASTAAVTSTGTFGIRYTHISLWDSDGFLDVAPGIGGDIVGLVSMNDQLVIIKEGAIYRLIGGVSYNGASNSLDLQVVSTKIGAESNQSWAQTDKGLILVKDGSIYLYDGNGITNISEGAVAEAYEQSLRSINSSVTTAVMVSDYNGFLPYKTKVSVAGRYVTFSNDFGDDGPVSTSTAFHAGNSPLNKHLVLNVDNGRWFFVSNARMNTPAAVISHRGGTFWLNKLRPMIVTGAEADWVKLVQQTLVDEVFSTAKPGSNPESASINRYSSDEGHVITHPVSGYGSMKSIRPRAVSLKRTLAATSTGVANRYASSTAVQEYTSTAARIFVHNSEAGFVPNTGQSPTEEALWWDAHNDEESKFTSAAYSSGQRVASMDDPSWQMRSGWAVAGSTATGNAVSQVDKVLLNNIDSTVTAPSIHYRDSFWSGRPSGNNLGYEAHILHALSMEYDEAENGTDR